MATDRREGVAARVEELEAALRLAADTIRGLAEQQAMPDDFYRATLARIDEAQALNTACRVKVTRPMRDAAIRWWRRFKKWSGFPEYEDLPRCSGCGEPVTIGEFPVYPWVCRNPVTPECWR